jgi:hypothetical protein
MNYSINVDGIVGNEKNQMKKSINNVIRKAKTY